MFELLLNEKIYQQVICEHLPKAKRFIWFVTADIKDMYIDIDGKYRPLIEWIANFVDNGVAVRLIHAKEPGVNFRKDFDRFAHLLDNDLFERILCPRVHTKAIIFDGHTAFVGSANMTGAGLGAKHKDKRNFEAGVIFDDAAKVRELMDWVDDLYLGNHCINCRRREFCPDPIA